MRNALAAIALCGAIVWWQARSVEEAPAAQLRHAGRLMMDDAGAADRKGGVRFRADTGSGTMELQLPGGIAGKFPLPDGLDEEAKFDLDGVGRYPGARLESVDLAGGGDQPGRVVLGFAAPGSADAVADWYEQAFRARGRRITRSGNRLSGIIEDGDAMVMQLEDAGRGQSRGRITITTND